MYFIGDKVIADNKLGVITQESCVMGTYYYLVDFGFQQYMYWYASHDLKKAGE